MARRSARDYKKPFYICSFGADEILFNAARGTGIVMDRYDGSLPLSLDSLEIRRVCGLKEYRAEFPSAFFTERSGTGRAREEDPAGGFYRKTFCNAVINVDFSSDRDFTDVERILEDYDHMYPEDASEGKEEPSFDPPLPDERFGRVYRELLQTFRRNRMYRRDAEGRKKEKTEQTPGLILDRDGLILEKVSVSAEGTVIGVSVRIKNGGASERETPVRLLICRKEPDDTQRLLGILESSFTIGSRKSRTLPLEFDIRDLTEKDESEKEYRLRAGDYMLYAGKEKTFAPVAVLRLEKEIRQPGFHRAPGWLDETEWETKEDSFPAEDSTSGIPVIPVSSLMRETYKACGRIYDGILEYYCDIAVNRCNSKKLLTEGQYLRLMGEGTSLKFRMRYVLYEEGFDALCRDGVLRHFVPYKRSAGKSKSGSCLFIWDRLYDHMVREWTWMGFDLHKTAGLDPTSVKAYEALTLSSIENEFSLDPESILLLDSPKGAAVKGNRRIVCKKGGPEGGNEKKAGLEIRTLAECASCKNEACREAALSYRNAIWDGQALLDESVFERIFAGSEGAEPHGMVLLRNHFFKACAFHTRIPEYYKEQGIRTVYDKFGKRHKAEKIRLIITTDSLKFLKFAPALFPSETEEKSEEAAFIRWKKHISDMPFGVVKKDEESKDRYNVGYQILNTLPLGRDEMERLFSSEKEYIEELWRNDEFFVRKIPKQTAMGRFMIMMYERFPREFVLTDQYIGYKRRMINDIKKRIRRGRLKLDGDMYTLCSMPYEMLAYSGLGVDERQAEDAIRPLLGPDEAYIGGMRDGERITLCRYPHMSSGSVCVLKQKSAPEFEKWFRLRNPKGGSNIVLVSPWESNIMVKLGGADFDSDTALFIKDPVFREAAESLLDPEGILAPLCGKYAPEADGLPVAQAGEILKAQVPAKAGGKTSGNQPQDMLTGYPLSALDHKLARSQMNIGSISNNIQLFNCYLWEALFRIKEGRTEDERTEDGYAQAVYECILKLAVLNELEIDRAKHSNDLATNTEMQEIMNTRYKGIPVIESLKKKRRSGTARQDEAEYREMKILYQPAFLYEIKRDRGNMNIALRGGSREKRYWYCPADQLAFLVSKLRKPREIVVKKEIVFRPEALKTPGMKADSGQVKRIESLLKETLLALDRLDRRGHTTDDEMEKRERIQTDLSEGLSAMRNIREKTMLYVLRDTMCVKKGAEGEAGCRDPFLYRNRYRILGLLLMASDRLDRRKKEKDPEKNVILRCLDLVEIIDM
ncbi:MAG: hypothetical protein K6F53_06640 [Lachnospiraceae bacterium]|nr:hypothetical protein [Lachnospiraceae bacterium]